MSKKKVPPCALVAGEAPDSARPSAIIVIALIFGFEAYLLSTGIDAVTAVVLVTAGVIAASLTTVKPTSIPAALKSLTVLVHLLRGAVAP
ncbi:hypothetical protein [Amycolatopsis australiensis]|uniref:Uncharacterized protein n=1 Tax=Amycolatopsis australiensis TaxID=546364 RepID=A0A1K1LRW6_9PSEU|nr:hypothetical protein [Amycolatopsis australiensis]SFW13603.1 hypothetical protein SAMN04489730_0174 [Amycolatopsis australiensis]